MDDPQNTRETALQDFLKAFRIALNYISLYSKEHKSFLASVSGLKSDLDRLLAETSPLVILFSADALSVDGITFSNKQVYLDLARQFHFRKVKSLQISSGVTIQELSSVLEAACIPVKDVIRKGGVQHVLYKSGAVNVKVEELDYSSFLRDEGGIEADIGAYLLNQSMQGMDPAKIREFSEHFEAAIAHISIRHIAENSQLEENLRNFFAYLRTSDEAAFHRCTQSLFRVVLMDKTPATLQQMSVFAGLVKELSADSIAKIIVDEASLNDEFNSVNLSLFLQALKERHHDEVHLSLAQAITARDPSQHLSPRAARKLKDLFTVSEAPLVAGIYAKVIETLSRNAFVAEPVTFSRDRAQENYRFILVFALGFEQDEERLDMIAQKICLEWQNVTGNPVPEYFQELSAAIASHHSRLGSVNSMAELDLLLRRFIEETALQKDIPDWMSPLIDGLQESTWDERWYFEKMFGAGRINRHSLSLFLRLFPGHMARFCEYLAQSAGNIEFVADVIEELKQIDSPHVQAILENIYRFSNDLIKIEVIQAMVDLPDLDEGFFLPILAQENTLLRKEAAAAMASRDSSREKALNLLLHDDDLWGRKNAFIGENIGIVEELRIGEAVQHLHRLARKPFFWNASVRRRAKKALEALS